MDYAALIKNSPLSFSLIDASGQIIKQWLAEVKARYQLPTLHGIHIDSQQIEDDVITALASAINSLVSTKEAAKKSQPGWSYGYICGHAQGGLNVTWTHRYLIASSMEFEDLLKLIAVRETLKLDQIWQPIANVYAHVLRHKAQWAAPQGRSIDSTLRTQSEDASLTKHPIRRDEFVGYLDHLLLAQHSSLTQKYEHDCCPELEAYIAKQALIKLVGLEHFA